MEIVTPETKPVSTVPAEGAIPASEAIVAPSTDANENAGISTNVDWGILNEDFDLSDEELELEAGEIVVPSVAPVTPEVIPGTETPAAAVETPTPAVAPVVPAVPATPVTPAPAAPATEVVPIVPAPEAGAQVSIPDVAPAAAPEQQAEVIKQARQEQMGKFKDYYAMSEEQTAEILTNPNEVVPEMLANLHMTVLENTVQTIAGMIPQMVSQAMTANKNNSDANNAFFTAWPKLNKAEYSEPLGRMIQLYRANNPGATNDVLIQEVGAAAHIAFKVAPDGVEAGGIIPAIAATPAAGGGGFVPAAPGGGGAVPAVKDTSVWGELNADFDKEEN